MTAEVTTTPGYWIERAPAADDLLLSAADIAALNAQLVASADSLADLRTLPNAFAAGHLLARLHAVSKRPGRTLCYRDGNPLTDADFARYETNLNLAAITGLTPIRFGLCVRRANMRTYPTDDVVHKPGPFAQLDRFQESGLFPADAVAVLHESTDSNWFLVQSANYLAWVRSAAIAIDGRDRVLDYADRPGFLIVTADKLLVSVRAGDNAASERQLDMGTRLALIGAADGRDDMTTRHSDTHYRVDFPVRDANGSLHFVASSIAQRLDVHPGYLPFTRRRLIEQAFKFLGESYGWGHSGDARDCSGFIAEIHRTFGIGLPRNADDQADCRVGTNRYFNEHGPVADKLAALPALQAGDLIFTPGHVMLFLGMIDDEPFVIHDASTICYGPRNGDQQSSEPGGVAVSPLLQLHIPAGRRHVDAITCIKRLWQSD